MFIRCKRTIGVLFSFSKSIIQKSKRLADVCVPDELGMKLIDKGCVIADAVPMTSILGLALYSGPMGVVLLTNEVITCSIERCACHVRLWLGFFIAAGCI